MKHIEEFISRWRAERQTYDLWGRAIVSLTEQRLATAIAPIPTSYFLKTAVVPRLKDDQKLIEKAFYRAKGYQEPYGQITDKVGIRFVVLLGREISQVTNALTSFSEWTYSRDRDYEKEQTENPLEFDYAAVHYVVRPKSDFVYEGVTIAADTPCEVQIKTLLQHAYSELTHDTIYKSQIEATPIMRRNAAKSMALLEATNDYFEKVADEVDAAIKSLRQVTNDLSAVYKTMIGFDAKPTRLEGMLLNAYETVADGDYVAAISGLLAEKSFIAERIRQRVAAHNPIFSQPSILLTYLALTKSVQRGRRNWPLTPSELEPILNDLGESSN